MSRCFPFPPPGYVPNVIRDEALIESIKREEEKAKKEQKRKERKREKKDSKDNKEKKDKKDKKRKERERGEGESEKHSHKRRRKEEVSKDGKNDQKVDVFSKLKESENGCLDKSSLTVERELLQSTSQNSCDSTLNSNELLPKQQKEKQQPHNNDSESIIRIRLPIRRQNVPEVMMVTTTNKDQQKPCPIRRQNDPEVMIVTTNKDQKKPCPSQEIKLDPVKIVTREQPQQHYCSTSAPEQASKPQHPCSTSAPAHVPKPREEKRKDHSFTKKLAKEKKLSSTTNESSNGVCRFCPPSLAVQFLNVVENWVPNRVELTNSEDDECWWFMKKPSLQKFGTERCRQLDRNNETKQVISSSMAWPCARLLPEVDVHALPYTVPF